MTEGQAYNQSLSLSFFLAALVVLFHEEGEMVG